MPPPQLLPLRHCTHPNYIADRAEESENGEEDVLSEEECLLDLLSGGARGNQQAKNKQHFVLATADQVVIKSRGEEEAKGHHERDRRLRCPHKRNGVSVRGLTDLEEGLRFAVRQIPGVPIIYVKRSVMILEEFSSLSTAVRMREEKEKFRKGLLAKQNAVSGLETRSTALSGTGDASKANEADPKTDPGFDGANATTHTTSTGPPKNKKRGKKVRGPNPLSVLKKKKKPPKQKQTGYEADPPAQKRAAPLDDMVGQEQGRVNKRCRMEDV